MTTIAIIVTALLCIASYYIGRMRVERTIMYALTEAKRMVPKWEELFIDLIKSGHTDKLDFLMATYFRIRGEWKI